jgi:glycosyltransferase involved in cell wall biosynthesis
VKDDLVRHYRIVPDKVQVIPWGPPSQPFAEPSTQDIARVREQHKLTEPFLLYPAMTWPHKNHIRLLEALAELRDESGLKLRLVCTGSHLEPYWSAIQKRIAELNLAGQVYFTGFISQVELRAIYRLAEFLIVPTLFESDSSPIYEAWLEGLPVACSNVTSLPAQTLNAARLFDPYDVAEIARAVRELATNEDLRADLRATGFERLKDYQWERTAKAYRALYRRTADRALSAEDRWLLNWDWMTDPHKTMEASA